MELVLKQGDDLSFVLFNLLLQQVVQNVTPVDTTEMLS